MATEYIVWIAIEQCEADGDDYDRIENVGEPRQAGRFRTERQARRHVEYLLEHAETACERRRARQTSHSKGRRRST